MYCTVNSSDAPPSENLPISIKKELDCEQETAGPGGLGGLGGAAGVPVKQRHASSPPNYFYGDQAQLASRRPAQLYSAVLLVWSGSGSVLFQKILQIWKYLGRFDFRLRISDRSYRKG